MYKRQDKKIVKNYSVDTFRKDKKKNKLALQEELGLQVDDKVMMLGIVSRLTDQKGFDLIAYVMDELCQDAIQLVVLGTGEERYENMFRHFAWKYQGKVSANIYYSEEMSHKVYASCDAFLMPSLFEPCGLSQLMSLRYGTVPIVRETGGLKDTVEPVSYTHLGRGQLAWKLRQDERVVSMEKTNIRYVTPEDLGEPIDFSSIDVSFISLTKVLLPIRNYLKEEGEIVALIKPQFEAGREKVGKKGVVREKSTHHEVIEQVISYAVSIGFKVLELEYSPIKGPEGNIEYLVHLKKTGDAGSISDVEVDLKGVVDAAFADLAK